MLNAMVCFTLCKHLVKKREANFREVPFFIEANSPQDVELLKAVAGTLTDKVYEADSAQRKKFAFSGRIYL